MAGHWSNYYKNSEKSAMPKPENIEPHKFKKGKSGNPKGRPKKIPELDKLLADVMGEEKDGMTAAEAILKKLRQMATGGNLRAAEILLDRAYGKVKQHHELTGADGGPLQVTPISFFTNEADQDK
jgi:hypothetical protein